MREPVIIIAEAGVNHNGSMEIAKKLIDEASRCGVDYVKFQTFKASKLVSKAALKADYQMKNTGNKVDTQLEMLKKLELSADMHLELIKYCQQCNVKFLSSPFDIESADFLKSIGIETFKIPSGEITNTPFLQHIGSFKKQVIISTGMSTLDEVREALHTLINAGTLKESITVLQCNTEYPTPYEDVNLLAMQTMQQEFNVKVGYSDHTKGIEIPIAAVALGAKVIEKHFTLDRAMEGPDHKASLEPNELCEMVKSIRNVEKGLGNGVKTPSDSEKKNIAIARKSLHYSNNLKQGHVLTINDIVIKRPGDGLKPSTIGLVLGKVLKMDVAEDSKVKLEDLQ